MNYLKSRKIPSYYLYDDLGSDLYDQITRLKEYYPFNKEKEILETNGSEIVNFRSQIDEESITFVEFGAGYSEKTIILLELLLEKHKKVTFVPIDVSESACKITAEKYSTFERLDVHPFVGTYDMFLETELNYPDRVIFVFLGSSLGNLEPDQQVSFLKKVREKMRDQDNLFIGIDTVYKNEDIIKQAYDDDLKITDKFILNAIPSINTKYGVNIDANNFIYNVTWNPTLARIEMGMICIKSCIISDDKTEIEIKENELIQISNSHKFDVETIQERSERSGLKLQKTWFSSDKYFMFCCCTIN